MHARARELRRDLDALREQAGTRDRDLDRASRSTRSKLSARLRTRSASCSPSGSGWAGSTRCGAPPRPAARRWRRRTDGVATLLAEAERLAEAVAGVDQELDALAERMRGLRLEAEDLAGAAPLRHGARGPARATPGGGGAARHLRPARAQARRQRRGGAPARRALPRRARPAAERRGGNGAGRGRARGGGGPARRACGRPFRGRADAAPRLAAVEAELTALALADAFPSSSSNVTRSAERRRASGDDAGAEPRGSGRAAAGGGVRRRAVARDAGADDRRRRERRVHAFVFDEVDAGGRADRAGGGGAPAGAWARSGSSYASPICRRSGRRGGGPLGLEKSADDELALATVEAIAATVWSRSCAGCSAPSVRRGRPALRRGSRWWPPEGSAVLLGTLEPDPSMLETRPQTRFIFVTGASSPPPRQGHRVRLDRPPAARARGLCSAAGSSTPASTSTRAR